MDKRTVAPPRLLSAELEDWTFGRFIDEIGQRHAALPAMVASDHSRGGASDHSKGIAGDHSKAADSNHSIGTAFIGRWTYAEMARDVHALQWALTDLGIQPGERVGVMLSSFAEWVLYLFAVSRLGAAFVPINMRFKARELQHVLKHSGAETLIATGRYLGQDHAATIAEVCGARGADGRFTGLPELQRLIGVGASPHPDATDTADLLARGRAKLAQHGVPPREDDAQTTAILFYTSGTTSFPKGVPLSHRNLLAHSVKAGELLSIHPGERVLTLYPFFGISGGANKVLSTFGCGASLVFQDAYRPAEACDLLEAEHCTVIHAVDVQVRELVAELKKRGRTEAPKRRGTIAFMAGVDAQLAQDMGIILGLRRFIHPYGMTETNPMVLRNELHDAFEASVRPGGRVAPDVEIRVVDPETDEDRAIDQPGEIVMRGRTVTKEYFNDPEATAAAFRNGWFHSGDLGVKTAEGFIFYVGRLKDMLKVGGFNVAPQEVESFLRGHPAVADVAVTGGTDARLGEVPVAFIVLKPDATITADALREHCRQHVANFKVPRAIWFVDALPYHTAANGSKLQRHIVRDWAREYATQV
jgi:fatty-acyl-CoA synthase